MIRKARDDEYVGTCGEVTFVSEEEGVLRGYICLTRYDDEYGKRCVVHDLQADGDGAVGLMARARTQAREWGFTELQALIHNPRLAELLIRNGWELELVTLKGKI